MLCAPLQDTLVIHSGMLLIFLYLSNNKVTLHMTHVIYIARAYVRGGDYILFTLKLPTNRLHEINTWFVVGLAKVSSSLEDD